MKKILLLLLCITQNVFAAELPDFNSIKSFALTGQPMHIVIDFTKCTAAGQKPSTNTLAGVYTPNELLISDSSIMSALQHFTLSEDSTPLMEFVRYTITNDNNITVTLRVLELPNYLLQKFKVVYVCKINDAARVYG